MALFSRHGGEFEQAAWQSKAMSEEEYHQLEHLSPERKYEYISGRVYMMSGGSVAHDLLAYNMRTALNNRLRAGTCRAFGADVQVLLGQKKNGKPHFVYPDTTVSWSAEDRRRDNTLLETPRVVVEVLSPGTETRDRGVKFKAYQHCQSVQEIVLINQYSPYIEVWQRNTEHPDNPDAWLYRHYRAGQNVELISLDLLLPMDEIYQDLDFGEEAEDEA